MGMDTYMTVFPHGRMGATERVAESQQQVFSWAGSDFLGSGFAVDEWEDMMNDTPVSGRGDYVLSGQWTAQGGLWLKQGKEFLNEEKYQRRV